MIKPDYKVSYNVAYVISNDNLKWGFKKGQETELENHREIVKGRAQYENIGFSLYQDYLNAETKRVSNLINLYLYKAIEYSIPSMMHAHPEHEDITKSALHFYNWFSDRYKDIDQSFTLASHLGSLAFTLVKYPYRDIEDVLGVLKWQQEKNFGPGTVREKWERIKVEEEKIEEGRKKLRRLLESPLFRRNYLSGGDINHLGYRVFFGEIDPIVMEEADLVEEVKRCVCLGWGGGGYSFMQSLIVDAYLEMVNILLTVPVDLPLNTFEVVSNFKEERYRLAVQWAVIYDAQYMKNFMKVFNHRLEITEYQVLSWLRNTGVKRISKTEEGRLWKILNYLMK